MQWIVCGVSCLQRMLRGGFKRWRTALQHKDRMQLQTAAKGPRPWPWLNWVRQASCRRSWETENQIDQQALTARRCSVGQTNCFLRTDEQADLYGWFDVICGFGTCVDDHAMMQIDRVQMQAAEASWVEPSPRSPRQIRCSSAQRHLRAMSPPSTCTTKSLALPCRVTITPTVALRLGCFRSEPRTGGFAGRTTSRR